MVSDDPTFLEKAEPLLACDYAPIAFMGTDEEKPGPFYITDELMNIGVLLTYKVEIYDQPDDKEDYWMEYLCVNDSRDELY